MSADDSGATFAVDRARDAPSIGLDFVQPLVCAWRNLRQRGEFRPVLGDGHIDEYVQFECIAEGPFWWIETAGGRVVLSGANMLLHITLYMRSLSRSAVLLALAGCASERAVVEPPAAAPRATAILAASAPDAQSVSAHSAEAEPPAAAALPAVVPFAGRGDAPTTEGNHYTADQHPYAFLGRLSSGSNDCEESVGITFRNVRSLGFATGHCEYRVSHDDEKLTTLWAAVCNVELPDVPPASSSSALNIDDRITLGRDGKRQLHEALYVNRLDLKEREEPLKQCVYKGFIAERD